MAYARVANETTDAVEERAVIGSQQYDVNHGQAERIQLSGEYNNRTIEVPKINHKALGRPTDIQYERNLASVQSRLKAIGVAPATVVSFLPITLISSSYIDTLRKARIRPPKKDQPYTTFLIEREEIVPTRMGADSPLLAFDIHPIQLANEFASLFSSFGGVMCFVGRPEDISKPGWAQTISEFHGGLTYGAVLEQARTSAIVWMRQMLSSGNSKAAQNRAFEVFSHEKDSARRLLDLGDITELPKWVEEQRDLNIKRHSCPKCQKPVDPGIAQCLQPGCGYIVDPEQAYKIQAIDEGDPALERLTRDQVIAMGISDYVAETIDEKPTRLALGSSKPKSLAVMRLEEANDELRRHEADEAAKKSATLFADAAASLRGDAGKSKE